MGMSSGRGCAICGSNDTEACHVKAKREFDGKEISVGADRKRNIINLCQSHHRLMDNGWVAIAPSCDRVLYRDGVEKCETELQYTVNVAVEYIRWRNEFSNFVQPFPKLSEGDPA